MSDSTIATDSGAPASTAIEVAVKNASGRAFGRWISGPTTGGVAVIVTLRKAWAPSIATHNVEPSSESASAPGSEPIGMADRTDEVDGSTTTIVLGYVSAPPATLT